MGLVLLVSAFSAKEYGVEREIIINKPCTEVFNFVKILRNQDQYSAWKFRDKSMKSSFKGTDGTIGFISSWESEDGKSSKGEQEIIGMEENHKINFELRFEKPVKSTSNTYMITEIVSPAATKVKWGFKGKMSFPINIMLLFMDMEGPIKNDFDEGLKNLKSLLESQKTPEK
jgi:hypothetical protein